MSLKGLRVITNLHCNFRCRFCYQGDKSEKVLDPEEIKRAICQYAPECKPFEYCTIMGGESTLLPNLDEYIRIASAPSLQTRLTTNGSCLTLEKCEYWKRCGLTGINVSVPTLGKDYGQVTGSNRTSGHVMNAVYLVRHVFGPEQTRVNIPLCRANLENGEMLKGMMLCFAKGLGIKVTLCEDVLETYSIRANPEKYGLKLKQDTGFGLLLYDLDGSEIGCYAHKDNYKDTDLVVTPVGTFVSWDGYCQAVGLNPNH